MTYTQLDEWLEQTLAMTCTKWAMRNVMQTPFKTMAVVSIDVLREDEHIYCLKTVYNERPHISMYALRMKLAVSFGVTASADIMSAFMLMLPRAGVGRHLYTKTSPAGPTIVKVSDLSPYFETLYLRIAEEHSVTVQKLSAYFVADHCMFFDPIALKEAIVRLNRRHVIFEAWRKELDQDFGLVRKDGLPSLELPINLGSMSEHLFFFLIVASRATDVACGHSHLSVSRLF